MKKWLVLIACVALLGTNATAQTVCPNEDPDEICIIFDYPDLCCQNCTQFFGGPLSAYVVLHNCTSAAGVSGYEFCLCNPDGSPFSAPPSCFITGYTYPPSAINAATEPCFAVGVASPIANAGYCTLLLTVNLLVFCPDEWCFGVEPSSPSSLPDAMAYADGADPGLLKPMAPCTGREWNSCMMACVNATFCPPGPPIDVEDATWGSVKNLYK